MKTSIKKELIRIKENNPQLIFDNNGYEYLSPKVREENKEAIEEVSNLLKESLNGFSRFDNFKPRKDGSFSVRCQYNYNHGEKGLPFYGVGYFGINEFENEFIEYKPKH
jgi:hypothetical protein